MSHVVTADFFFFALALAELAIMAPLSTFPLPPIMHFRDQFRRCVICGDDVRVTLQHCHVILSEACDLVSLKHI